jgi:hypothetical protein
VGSYLKLIGEGNLENVRIIQHDAVEVLTNMIAPDSGWRARVLPDPWHKARHNKRRLIQSPLVQLISTRLAQAAISTAPPTGKNMPSRCWKCSAEATLKNTEPIPPATCRVRITAIPPVRKPACASVMVCGTWCLKTRLRMRVGCTDDSSIVHPSGDEESDHILESSRMNKASPELITRITISPVSPNDRTSGMPRWHAVFCAVVT